MATLEALKRAFKAAASLLISEPNPNTNPNTNQIQIQKQPLTDEQYLTSLSLFHKSPNFQPYKHFIIPQLSLFLTTITNSRPKAQISILEIGPGPKSILAYVPAHLRRRIGKYTAYEPNGLFVSKLEEWVTSSESGRPLPCLEKAATIYGVPFTAQQDDEQSGLAGNDEERFDIVLFCHSMYGMKPKRNFIQKALNMLVKTPQTGMVIVFHRDGVLDFEGLVCHQTASYPTGVVIVKNDDETLDQFASFIAGFNIQDDTDNRIRGEWRKICRDLGHSSRDNPDHLMFSVPEVMVAFTQSATALPELAAEVPLLQEKRAVKNREANFYHPAAVVRPTNIQEVQKCVQWARKHGANLAVIGGGHSGQCVRSHVVSVDMNAFNQVHIVKDREYSTADSTAVVIAEAGCKTGDIINRAMTVGLTVPLGSRPSVGAGLWLQGGIGHLARQHGLTCDSIVGAVLVSVDSAKILYVGSVPSDYCPEGAARPENEAELLWAIKGAGTNFGIVISVTFKSYRAPTYLTRSCLVPLSDDHEAQLRLREFNNIVVGKLPDNCSADAYLYWDGVKLQLGMTMYECNTAEPNHTETNAGHILLGENWGEHDDIATVDGVGLFESEMYMSTMHGGHSGGKTSSFKRCVFLKGFGQAEISRRLVTAVETRPTPFCYLHLLHGGEAVSKVAADATAFGCRDWDFACVITGVWPREQDGAEIARSAEAWVYSVARNLLPWSSGVYCADLGPDARDAVLAAKAFGRNGARLACLKNTMDPYNVLAYACPFPRIAKKQKLIILVTGESCAGKDYCADIWASVFQQNSHESITARVVSISDETKRQYAAHTGADFKLLLSDRAYKEEHRPSLTKYFQDQVQQRPNLPKDNFMDIVEGAGDLNVLIVTGMRENAPVATFAPLLPDIRLLEVHVQASDQDRQIRRECRDSQDDANKTKDSPNSNSKFTQSKYGASLVFENNKAGNGAAKKFAEIYLLRYIGRDLQNLANMVGRVPDFPRQDVEFHHVLGISQQPGGLELCTSLLKRHFASDWAQVDAVAACESGGFVFASALALRVGCPLALIRQAGKLPPPTVSITKHQSYISSCATSSQSEKRFEMERDIIPQGGSVVVVDDVLSTGETLCSVLQLLKEVGLKTEDIKIMVVAEFPKHGGRHLLRERGFGKTLVQSLLVFGGC